MNATSIGKTGKRKDIEQGRYLFLQHGKRCSMIGNVIPGSDRIPGSHNTAASATTQSSTHKVAVSGKLQLFQLSTLRRRHSSLI